MPCILIVEDDGDIRESVRQVLRNPAIELLFASNGLEALEVLEAEAGRVELIILDLMMPRLSGWELLVELRAHEALARVPVVVMSSLAAPPQQLGAQAYLQKPFDARVLTKTVERLLKIRFPSSDGEFTPEPVSGASWKSTHAVTTNVLVVDDESEIRDAVAILLRDYNFGILTARDGVDAMAVLRSGGTPVDLIVLDLMMPHCTGQELIAQLRAEPAFRHIPVLVVSALAVNARELNVQACLRKPFEATVLVEAVERLTNHSIAAA